MTGQKDFNLMTDLAKSFREELSEIAEVQTPHIQLDHLSRDGTRKWLLDVGTKNGIEAVFIPEKIVEHFVYPLKSVVL